MTHENEGLDQIVTKMGCVADTHYEGRGADNAYSVFMHLTDIEKIRYMRFSYRLVTAVFSVVDATTCNRRTRDNFEDIDIDPDDRDLEVTDRRELVRLKHKAILTVGKIILGMLCILFVGVILLSFVSADMLTILGGAGKVLNAVVDSEL